MKGFFGKILHVDLTHQKWHESEVKESIYEQFLGGKGLGTYLLLKENPPLVDPLSSANRIIFTLGPLTGSRIWGSSRYAVITKSPLTGFYTESYAGGKAAEIMNRTGYDAIVIYGRSPTPTLLEIHDEGVTFHDAKDLWGLDTYEAEERALAKVKGGTPKTALVIGPAGEHLVKFAVIGNDRGRQAGRTGVGAVMGAKNLKGIVFHGSKQRDFFDPSAIDNFAKEVLQQKKDDKSVLAYKRYGTPQLVAIMNQVKGFPSRYWFQGSVEHWKKISAEAVIKECNAKPKACPRCFMACAKVSYITEGRHKGLRIEGPEYETIYAFGGLCLVNDIKEIAYLNDLCDRLGLDTITTGNLIAFAIEAGRRKKIEQEVNYGDVDSIAKLIKHIAYRESIGDTLSQGIVYAAKQWGLEGIAIHVKGLEPAGYDPRVLKGMALAYAISARGACHLRTTFYKAELSGIIDPKQIEGKAKLLIDYEDRLAIFDSLILCRFFRDIYHWEELSKIVRMTTGINLEKDDLRKVASQIVNATREFNLREGLSPNDELLPQRFHQEPLPDSGSVITKEEFNKLLNDYYQLRGWSAE